MYPNVCYISLGSLECECPTEHRFQTNRPFSEDEGELCQTETLGLFDTGSDFFFFCVCACACKKRIMFVSLRERKCARLWGRDCVCVLTDLFKQRVARLFVCARKTSVWWFCLHFSLISANSECAYTWTRLRVSQLSLLLRWVKMETQQLKRAAASCTASFQTVSETDSVSSFCFFVSKHQLLCIRLFFLSQLQQK